MITNDISQQELNDLLVPCLRLSSKAERECSLKRILQYDFESPDDLLGQQRIRFVYRKSAFTIRLTDWDIYIIFSAPKSIWPSSWFQNRKIIEDLTAVCKRELAGIEFKAIVDEINLRCSWDMSSPDRYITLTHLIDSRGIDLKEAAKNAWISPLVICHYVTEKDRRAEIRFNWTGYRRENNQTIRLCRKNL